jgi:hypothetical protein
MSLTKVVESPKRPCSPALLDRLDVVVNPSIRYGAALIRHLELLQETCESCHPDNNDRLIHLQRGGRWRSGGGGYGKQMYSRSPSAKFSTLGD